ncbi:Uncharacterised protein [Mycobacteroides abscessus subsp. abscessus]|nr:Uncharacterised protein [Mycobacteroides abscessus subsp. abscessus]
MQYEKSPAVNPVYVCRHLPPGTTSITRQAAVGSVHATVL